MLRLLLQAGAALATFNLGRKVARLKRTAIFLGIAGVLGLLGLGALTAAAIIGLAPHVGAIWSPVIVAAVLILIAALLAWIGTRTPKPATPPMLTRMTQIGAAGAALNATRPPPAKRSDAVPPPAQPKRSRKRVINMMLIATIAGVVLGRRL
ncbi:phage holin family protein [Hansschlegelia sp.]|uniref:phage holin family protein n=1 Tax=Hansschlegelia sp. TaxID=2041892 RepID=UPI002C996EB2|nr:phage holin family protein [Hansschlegelia sp.]HVI28932.1 phage holin family protein [Hansschlegelia sp.]